MQQVYTSKQAKSATEFHTHHRRVSSAQANEMMVQMSPTEMIQMGIQLEKHMQTLSDPKSDKSLKEWNQTLQRENVMQIKDEL